jgi:hypothetical protein
MIAETGLLVDFCNRYRVAWYSDTTLNTQHIDLNMFGDIGSPDILDESV